MSNLALEESEDRKSASNNMALNIFSSTTLWSRSKQQYGKIGEIECLDTNNDSSPSTNPFAIRTNDLFVGTTDGFVYKLRLREKTASSQNSNETSHAESKGYECLCIGSQNLGTRKPIVKLKAVTVSLRRVLTLSDNLFQVLDSDNLQPIPNIKLKNILTFAGTNATDQHQTYIEICTSTKRNKLQIYRLDRTTINMMHEVSVQDSLISIAMDECGILACSETNYFAYKPTTSGDRRSAPSFQSIFSLTDDSVSACFTRIASDQYLLNGPNIGITTSLQGTSQRAPLMFVSQPMGFVYSHPYLLVLVKDYVHIYSYLDDQLKQEISIRQCRTLTHLNQENSGSVLVTTKDNIFLLEPLGIEEQINQLLNGYRLQEALTLAESNCPSPQRRVKDSLVLSTKKRMGLIEFSAMNVVRALYLFEDAHVDFHEIIAQIPHFLPLYAPWPPLDESSKTQYTQWLNALCDYMNKRTADLYRQPDYYSTLLKAFVIVKSRETIIEFIKTNASYIPTDCHTVLFDASLFHATAILYSCHDKHEQALDIWKRLVLNELAQDDSFPGIDIIANYAIEQISDRSLAFATAGWLLGQNEELALKVFTTKHQSELNSDPFSSSRVIGSLKSHPIALTTYLEHTVFQLEIENEELHTMLVNIYLDQILAKSEDDEKIRSKLQAFLVTSNSFRIQAVLSRVSQTNRLRREVALLHGKMNNFEQAFRVLVEELEDFEFAESYCVALSYNKASGDRKIVAHILFKVFLSALDKHPEQITEALLRLLRNNEIEFDFVEVLQRLPSHWSLASVAQILTRALRSYSSTQRSVKLESALSRVQNEKLNIKLHQLKCSNTVINEYRRCKHCLQQFYETSCVVFQDGSQVHVHCAKHFNTNQPHRHQ